MEPLALEVKELIEQKIPSTGQWHQTFTLFMPSDPVTEQPFNRTGSRLDLSDPQARIDLWKSLKNGASIIEACGISTRTNWLAQTSAAICPTNVKVKT